MARKMLSAYSRSCKIRVRVGENGEQRRFPGVQEQRHLQSWRRRNHVMHDVQYLRARVACRDILIVSTYMCAASELPARCACKKSRSWTFPTTPGQRCDNRGVRRESCSRAMSTLDPPHFGRRCDVFTGIRSCCGETDPLCYRRMQV